MEKEKIKALSKNKIMGVIYKEGMFIYQKQMLREVAFVHHDIWILNEFLNMY